MEGSAENLSKGHGEKLSRKQEQAIIALMVKPTLKEAAGDIGIAENTLWRWMQLKEFQKAYKKARRDSVGQAIAQLQQACLQAVKTLQEIMGDKYATPSARVSAARTVLENSQKAIEIDDLLDRVEHIEKYFAKGKI